MNQPPLILVVDDEPEFREIFSVKLRDAGFRVETAKDAKEGIQKAKELLPDLILMDVQMSGVNGVDATMRLKDDAATKSLSILFLTNLGDIRQELQEANNRFSKEIGAIGYLRKTDDLDVLVQKIKEHFASMQN